MIKKKTFILQCIGQYYFLLQTQETRVATGEVEKCPLVDEICNINTNNMAKLCCSVFSLIFSCCLF